MKEMSIQFESQMQRCAGNIKKKVKETHDM